MNILVWNEKTYKEFLEYLFSLKDEKYKEFHKSLVLETKYEMIGIKLPILRRIAKDISKNNPIGFLSLNQNTYYEEVMLQGLVISAIKDEKVFNSYFKKHIKKIDNWALCDTFTTSIKIVKLHEKKYFKECLKLSLSNKEYISRVGLITILSHFINKDNLEEIFKMLDTIESDKYYINMAQAWLVCEMFIKHRDETLKYLENNKLNKFTQNKAISKIHDSYRVTQKDKTYLNKLKRK